MIRNEGSIPFTRSIKHQQLAQLCRKSAGESGFYQIIFCLNAAGIFFGTKSKVGKKSVGKLCMTDFQGFTFIGFTNEVLYRGMRRVEVGQHAR